MKALLTHTIAVGLLVPGLVALLSTPVHAGIPANVILVDADATGANDGTSWADAYNDLQDALSAIVNSQGTLTTVWIADGEYLPTATTDRTATFTMFDNVKIFGGFLGDESGGNEQDLSDRDVIGNPPAILSGEISDSSYGFSTCVPGAGADCFTVQATPGCSDASC